MRGLLGGAAPLGLSGVPLGHNVPLGGIDNWLFPGVAEVTHSCDYMVTMVVPKDTSTKHFNKNVLLDEPTLRLVKISTKRFDSPAFRQMGDGTVRLAKTATLYLVLGGKHNHAITGKAGNKSVKITVYLSVCLSNCRSVKKLVCRNIRLSNCWFDWQARWHMETVISSVIPLSAEKPDFSQL